IHDDEHQARIGGGEDEGQIHSVLIVNKDWNNEDKRLNFVSMILQYYSSLSAQLDINRQLAFHDYSMQSSYSFNDVIELINNTNNHEIYFIEEQQMKSELVDQTKYENLLMLLESSHIRHLFNILQHAHASLFSVYACASLPLPSISIKHRQKQDENNKSKILLFSPSHLCSLVCISYQPFQVSIGFKYIAQNADDPNQQCEPASDLLLFMVIDSIFSLFLLSTAYDFLKITSSVNKHQSDVSG
ncbi:unnamed protein product, partial [Rotaria sp. Silwood2]